MSTERGAALLLAMVAAVAALAANTDVAWLLAMGAAVLAVIDSPYGGIALSPGATAAIESALAESGLLDVAIATAAVAIGARVIAGVGEIPRPRGWQWPAVVAGVWLIVAPASLWWVDLRHELSAGSTRGTALAVAAGAVVVVAGWVSGQVQPPVRVRRRADR